MGTFLRLTSVNNWFRRCGPATSSSWTISPSQKREGVKLAIDSVGATLRYSRPYSPDLYPIELSFAKLKSILRKAESER